MTNDSPSTREWAASIAVVVAAELVGFALAYQIGMDLYRAIPSGVSWRELPSVFTPRLTLAVLFAVLVWFSVARVATRHRYGIVERAAGVRDKVITRYG